MFNGESLIRMSKEEEALINDPSISFWLKQACLESRGRDVLDAINDARLLLAVLEQRWKTIIPPEQKESAS
jgi:hypothetical protein